MKNYYSVDQQDKKWIFIDPDGNEFYSLGVDCVTVVDVDFMKPDEIFHERYNWFPDWADKKLSTILNLGFNTLGAWHHQYFWGNGRPKTVELSLSRLAKKVNNVWGVGFPDVFDESFRVSVHKVLIDCFYGKGQMLLDDKGMIGYYTDNELHWWGSGGYWGDNEQSIDADNTGLVDDYIRLTGECAGKKAWVRFIREKYGSIAGLNGIWGSEYGDFSDLLHLQHYRADLNAIQADKKEFLSLITKEYFEVTSRALKLYDPYHLNLGCRFVGSSTPDIVLELGKSYVDVNSFNFYSMKFPAQYLEHVYKITDKPVIIGEFSFCSGRADGFETSTNGARNVLVKNQERRGECYRDFVLDAFRTPFIVGTHWFALFDYGMNNHGLVGNYGLFDMNDRLWEEFASSVGQTHQMIGKSG